MFFFSKIRFSLLIRLFLFLFFLFLCFFLFFCYYHDLRIIIDWEIINFFSCDFKFSLLFDWVSLSFGCVVSFIAIRVIWFSFYYIENDLFIFRFTWLIVLFVLSIFFVIFIPNLVSLLLGWDGLGLVSFCLVIYYQNFKSLVSGLLTIFVNRIGDIIVLLRIGWLLSLGSWSFFFINYSYFYFWVGLFLIIAGITKRAQYPFCSWLPAAIAAPTPVSALVHSSTLVTAGIYLIFRFWYFLRLFSFFSFFLAFIGGFTIFLSGLRALFEIDLKKIIALSTLRQLRVILFSISAGYHFFGLFHLYAHALFKALLFLCAGTLIHNFSYVQDLRHLGFCWKKLPCVIVFLNLANLALCGFPFLSGFYSKDLILESFFFFDFNFFLFFLLFFSTFFTVSYSFRLSFYSLYNVDKGFSIDRRTKEKISIYGPLFFLGTGAIFGGFFFYRYFFFDYTIFFFSSFSWKIIIIIFLFIGIFVGYFFIFSEQNLQGSHFFLFLSYFGSGIWFLQITSTQLLIFFPLFSSFFCLYSFDRGYRELFGGQGLYFYSSYANLFFHLISLKGVFYFLSFIFFLFLFFFCIYSLKENISFSC